MSTYVNIKRTTSNLLVVGGVQISNTSPGTQIDLDSAAVKSDLLKNIGGYEFINDEVTTSVPVFPPIPTQHVSGYYYPGQHITSGTLAASQGDLRLCPFWVPADGSYDRIVVEMTTIGEAGSVVRMGIYGADQVTGFPLQAAAILDAGTIQTSSVTGAKEITISQVLTAGLVWLGAVNQLCATTPATLRTTTPYGQPIAATAIASLMGSGGVWSKTGVTGALPTWNITTGAAQTAVPKMYLRKA